MQITGGHRCKIYLLLLQKNFTTWPYKIKLFICLLKLVFQEKEYWFDNMLENFMCP